MKRILLLSALGTSLFAIPAFAECQLDLPQVEQQLQAVRLDANSAAVVKGLEASAETDIAKNNEFDCQLDINNLKTFVPLHHHMHR